MIPSCAIILLLLSASLLVQSHSEECAQQTQTRNATFTCGLWLAESKAVPGTLSTYTGKSRPINEKVAEPDALVVLVDRNKNSWSTLDAISRKSKVGLPLEGEFLIDIFIPGVGPFVHCSDEYVNMNAERYEFEDALGVHRSTDPTAGSFSYHHNFAFISTRELIEGEELIMSCSGALKNQKKDEIKRVGRPLKWLEGNAMCLDNLSVAPSTLKGVGRGAFSNLHIRKGKALAFSPVVHVDRFAMEIVEQDFAPDDKFAARRRRRIKYTSKVIGKQLLLNYCYGIPESNLLLLPYGPSVNFINHSREKANAVIQWWNHSIDLGIFLKQDANFVLGSPSVHTNVFIYMAKRDIYPGEEIFIDYGDEWIEAWEKHVSEWKPEDEDYLTAAEYQYFHSGEPIRTEGEQKANPYPDNIRTACYFTVTEDIRGMTEVEWTKDVFNCLRPCDVKERFGENWDTHYTAIVYPKSKAEPEDYCAGLPRGGITVRNLPLKALELVDRPYTTDTFLKSAFRHEIGVPNDMYPEIWNAADPKPIGDFIASPLKAGQLKPVRWKDTKEIVTPNAYRVGLSSQTREKILEYCDKVGITDTFRSTVVDGNSLDLGDHLDMELNGSQWRLLAPGQKWRADMQWLSPGDEESTQDWLEMLSAAGFDKILKGIGETLGLKGLAAFHGTFMGVSVSNKHYLQYGIRETGRKMFNIVIPLILANETGPELDIQDSNRTNDGTENLKVGRYRFEPDAAILLGDWAR
jgi:hypothetical protein